MKNEGYRIEERVLSYLPPRLLSAARDTLFPHAPGAVLSEVRLRAGRASSLSLYREGKMENRPFSPITEGELREVLHRVCGGSVYTFEESIKEGYIALGDGIRVGVGGNAVTRGGRVCSLSAVSSLVFRIPHSVRRAADGLTACFLKERVGILLFSPPGGGKTTLLREFAREISCGDCPMRVAVVDTRGEFYGFEEECLIDLLSGYPKAAGAEIAVRTLSPEVLVMDELGAAEAEALLMLSSFGVPTVASVHAGTRGELLASCGAIGRLLDTGVFGALWNVLDNKREDIL